MEEQWAMIEGFPDYAVSNLGRVMSLRFDALLAPRPNSYGHHRVVLYRDKVGYDRYVHHLVADAFTTGYSPGMQVRHRNQNKGDNKVSNLRYPARGMGQLITNPPAPRARRVRIMENGLVFRTVEDCAKYVGGDASLIYRVLRGDRRSHKGYTFEYLEEISDGASG